jgi:hypothetical protein
MQKPRSSHPERNDGHMVVDERSHSIRHSRQDRAGPQGLTERPGRNPNSGNECYAPGDQGPPYLLGLVTKRGHLRTAIYWLRIMWLTRGETRNDLETPDARSVDADRFHGVGPRRRDLHRAHRRG